MAFKLNCVAVCLALSMVFLNNVEGKECSDEDKEQCRPLKEGEEGPSCERDVSNDCSFYCIYKNIIEGGIFTPEKMCTKEGFACTPDGSSQAGKCNAECECEAE